MSAGGAFKGLPASMVFVYQARVYSEQCRQKQDRVIHHPQIKVLNMQLLGASHTTIAISVQSVPGEKKSQERES